MFEYNICNQADKTVFKKQCAALEKNIPELLHVDRLHDVDDSETQIYDLQGKTVTVYNDYYIGAVYIKSETDLLPYFN